MKSDPKSSSSSSDPNYFVPDKKTRETNEGDPLLNLPYLFYMCRHIH
jgi:hypothetical protein